MVHTKNELINSKQTDNDINFTDKSVTGPPRIHTHTQTETNNVELATRFTPLIWHDATNIYTPVKDVPVSTLTLLKQQISATPSGTIVFASVIWRWIQTFWLNSTQLVFWLTNPFFQNYSRLGQSKK